jgi:hypothetical protein
MAQSAERTTLYEVLGVLPSASPNQLRVAFRRLSLKFHPDRNPGDLAAAAQFQRVVDAYRVLSNKGLRAAYDRQISPPASVTDVFRPAGEMGKFAQRQFPIPPLASGPGSDAIFAIAVPAAVLETGGLVDLPPMPGLPDLPPALELAKGAGPNWYHIEGCGYRGQNGGPSGDAWIQVVALS